MPRVLAETDELRNELITVVMRMEKVLRTTGCKEMRDDVKKLRELLK
jgi:hypothetical protein